MKTITLPAIAALFIITGCSSTKKLVDPPPEVKPVEKVIEKVGADGSSFLKAIFITEKGEIAGVRAEYAWLKEKYPGYKRVSQRLVNNDKKPYDVVSIETTDGVKKDVYFDISGFYGKF